MITTAFAKQFSETWVKDWNSHNLENILSHYTDNFIIESPIALKRISESKGVISGKENVRKYWAIGLAFNPDLHFEILEVLIGIHSITIYYVNTTTQKNATELMVFNDTKKVTKAIVNYSA